MVNELKSLGLDVTVIHKGEELKQSLLIEQNALAVTGDDILD